MTDALSSGLATKVILGLSDPATADYAMNLIGDEWAEEEKPSRNWEGDITGTRTEDVPEQPFVSSEILSWDKGEGVILPPGGSYIQGRNRLLTQSHADLWASGCGRSIADRWPDDPLETPTPIPPGERADADDGDPAAPAADGGGWEPDARGNRDTGDSDD